MTYVPDLAPFPQIGPYASAFIGVGWLERGHDYTRGVVDEAVIRRLTEFRDRNWEPFGYCGFHNCDICEDSPERTALHADAWGGANLHVPRGRDVFVAPELILHYIRVHQYCPPPVFCDALMACPDMGSDAFFAAMSRTTWADIERQQAGSDAEFERMYAEEIGWYRDWWARRTQ